MHKIDEFQIDVTVFYIGYNSSAVLDMSQIRKPTSRWDVADRLPEKDIKVALLRLSFYRVARNEMPRDFPWGWQFLRCDHRKRNGRRCEHSLHEIQHVRQSSQVRFEVDLGQIIEL